MYLSLRNIINWVLLVDCKLCQCKSVQLHCLHWSFTALWQLKVWLHHLLTPQTNPRTCLTRFVSLQLLYRWASKQNQRSTLAQMIFSQISGLSLELLHRSEYHKPPLVSPRLHVSPCNLSWEDSILRLPKQNYYFPASHRLPGGLKCVQHCGPWDTETRRCVKLKGRWSGPQVHTALDLTAAFSLRPKQ